MLTPTQLQDVSRTGKSMAITNFEFPGVSLEQVFQEQAAGAAGTMDVVCVGQQYALHRANVASEAVLVPQSTPYDKTTGLTVALPGRNPAYTLDTDSKTQRLVVKNGQYEYTTLASTAVAPATRRITFASPVKDGNGYTAAAGFGTRGAKIGDTVVLTGTVSEATVTVTTEILGIYNVANVGYA